MTKREALTLILGAIGHADYFHGLEFAAERSGTFVNFLRQRMRVFVQIGHDVLDEVVGRVMTGLVIRLFFLLFRR